MSAAHTPGPWVVWTANEEIGSVTTADGMIAIAQAQQTRRIFKESDHDERRANARLIAAAPDLLAALQRLHDDTADYVRINNLGDPYQNKNMRDARDALVKARGQS